MSGRQVRHGGVLHLIRAIPRHRRHFTRADQLQTCPPPRRTSGWRRSVVASVVRRMNEVTVHWARLVLRWVTVFGRVYHHGV